MALTLPPDIPTQGVPLAEQRIATRVGKLQVTGGEQKLRQLLCVWEVLDSEL